MIEIVNRWDKSTVQWVDEWVESGTAIAAAFEAAQAA